MPTASKLIAAVIFAALAWFTSELIKPLMPEGTPLAWFSQGNALIGAACGWIVMGPRAGEGLRASIGGGLTTAAAMVFWGLLIHSIVEMIKLSLRKHYDGPVEAVIGAFQLALDFGKTIATPDVIITLVVGGILGGWLTEWVARRWP